MKSEFDARAAGVYSEVYRKKNIKKHIKLTWEKVYDACKEGRTRIITIIYDEERLLLAEKGYNVLYLDSDDDHRDIRLAEIDWSSVSG